MIDALIDAIRFDEFLIALAGQVANEASAKLTITAVKAIGLAMLGAIAGPLVEPPERPILKKKKPPTVARRKVKVKAKSVKASRRRRTAR